MQDDVVMARYSHKRKRWIRYDIRQNIAIRCDTIRKCFAVRTNYSYMQMHHKMGQHAGVNARRAAGGAPASCRDRETDAAGAFQYNTAGVKRDFQQHAMQYM